MIYNDLVSPSEMTCLLRKILDSCPNIRAFAWQPAISTFEISAALVCRIVPRLVGIERLTIKVLAKPPLQPSPNQKAAPAESLGVIYEEEGEDECNLGVNFESLREGGDMRSAHTDDHDEVHCQRTVCRLV